MGQAAGLLLKPHGFESLTRIRIADMADCLPVTERVNVGDPHGNLCAGLLPRPLIRLIVITESPASMMRSKSHRRSSQPPNQRTQKSHTSRSPLYRPAMAEMLGLEVA